MRIKCYLSAEERKNVCSNIRCEKLKFILLHALHFQHDLARNSDRKYKERTANKHRSHNGICQATKKNSSSKNIDRHSKHFVIKKLHQTNKP